MANALFTRPKLGPIAPDALYPLVALQERVGLGKTTMRTMRRQGLRVRYLCGRCFVRGADFIDFVEQHGRDVK